MEEKYNTFSLEQLKYNYELTNILTEAENSKDIFEEKRKIFNNFFNELEEDFVDKYEDVDNEFYKLQNLIDDFIEDLETIKSAFEMMGDIDRGTNYFKK